MYSDILERIAEFTLAIYIGVPILHRLVTGLVRSTGLSKDLPLAICSNCAVTTASFIYPRCGGVLCSRCNIMLGYYEKHSAFPSRIGCFDRYLSRHLFPWEL